MGRQHAKDARPSNPIRMYPPPRGPHAHSPQMSQDTDPVLLSATLAQLPRLRGLHVIGCPRISHTTVLRALSYTPDLRELSFTIFVSLPLSDPFPFPHFSNSHLRTLYFLLSTSLFPPLHIYPSTSVPLIPPSSLFSPASSLAFPRGMPSPYAAVGSAR